jgi:hypothetical protein
VSSTLEVRVEAAVAAVLEQRNGTVVQLVQDALDRQLARLVEAELEPRMTGASANGHAEPTRAPLPVLPPGQGIKRVRARTPRLPVLSPAAATRP